MLGMSRIAGTTYAAGVTYLFTVRGRNHAPRTDLAPSLYWRRPHRYNSSNTLPSETPDADQSGAMYECTFDLPATGDSSE